MGWSVDCGGGTTGWVAAEGEGSGEQKKKRSMGSVQDYWKRRVERREEGEEGEMIVGQSRRCCWIGDDVESEGN